MQTKERIRRSMLWAAYGDALGFITELCDESTLSYRTSGKSRVTEIISWKRKIGGQYGVSWTLPKGSYSDDTQLRLAVCRAIRGDGLFDVEPFAKVELPIFLAYALGAGTGTKTAADSLKKKSVHWNTNFYETSYCKYVDGGGNGAAMRIQPHVWSAKTKAPREETIRSILRDAIVTHGHPVALVGAVFHGLLLLDTLSNGEVSHVDSWQEILTLTAKIPSVISKDEDLSLLWLPEWERRTGMSFDVALEKAILDMRADLEDLLPTLKNIPGGNREKIYFNLVKQINGLDKRCRGSGTKTALLAAAAAVVFRNDTNEALVACANVLGSDTDTIATMVGALMGVVAIDDPPDMLLDQEYLVFQADRMTAIREGATPSTHVYPDLISWNAPSSTLDAIAVDNERFFLRGFGEVQFIGEKVLQKGSTPTSWQQCRTTFGQTLLIKRRMAPNAIDKHDVPQTMVCSDVANLAPKSECTMKKQDQSGIPQPELLERQNQTVERPLTVDEASDMAIKSGFDALITGKALMNLASQRDNGVEKVIGFAAIVAKAKLYRMKRDNGEKI